MGQLDGKKIVVVGGTTGLGLSAALRFVADGAKVVVVGRSQDTCEQAQNSLGENGCVHMGDAIEENTAPEAIELLQKRFGSLTGLYHVAGGSGRPHGDGPLHEVTVEGFDFTVNLNLKSLILSNRAAVRAFREHGQGGTILNMGSVLGYSPSKDYFATHVYAATKGAIIGFTRSAAAYYAKENIRLNVIAPALVETPMAQRAAQDEVILNFIKTKQPLDGGRIGKPEDLDGASAFFMSDESRFCTGQVLAIDGGWTVSEGQKNKKQPS